MLTAFGGSQAELALAEDFDQIRSAMEKVPPYSAIFTKVGSSDCSTLDKHAGTGSVDVLTAQNARRQSKNERLVVSLVHTSHSSQCTFRVVEFRVLIQLPTRPSGAGPC